MGETYITLQPVGLLRMLDVELLGVTGVVVELVPVGKVTGLSLTLLGMQELGLVRADFEVSSILLRLTCVLQVALEFAGCQGVHHLWVILHTAQAYLVALVLQMRLLVAKLLDNNGILTNINLRSITSVFKLMLRRHSLTNVCCSRTSFIFEDSPKNIKGQNMLVTQAHFYVFTLFYVEDIAN